MLKRPFRYFAIAFGIIAIFSWSGCKYAPTDTYYRELPPPDSMNMLISLNNLAPDDTIQAAGIVQFQYKISSGKYQVHEVHFLLDSQPVYVSTESADKFTLNTEEYINGRYAFSMEVITGSGTRSMADKLGAETMMVKHTWMLMIFNASDTEPFPPDNSKPAEISDISPKDGRLVITWSRFNGLHFHAYQLVKLTIDQYGMYQQQIIAGRNYSIDDTTWVDSSYVGGTIVYKVHTVQQYDGYEHWLPSESQTYQSPPPHFIGYEVIDPATLRFTWTRSVFSANFGEYRFWSSEHSDSYHPAECNEPYIYTAIQEVQDTVRIETPAVFGDTARYMLKTIPANDRTFLTHTCDYIAAIAGRKFYKFGALFYNPGLNVYYLTAANNSIVSVSGSDYTQTAQRTLSTQLAVSADGHHLYSATGEVIHALDQSSLQTLQTYDTGTLTGCSSRPRYLHISNTNILMYKGYVQNDMGHYIPDHIAVINMETQTSIAVIPNQVWGGWHQISANGEYFSTGKTLFRISGTEVDSIGPVKQRGEFWDQNGETRWVEIKPFEIKVERAKDLSEVRVIAHPYGYTDLLISSVDQSMGYLIVGDHESNVLYLYNLDTGNLTTQIPKAPHLEYKIVNNTLFSSAGYSLPLDLLGLE